MITYHYDVCIIAESPATYITAEILSRKGYRILLLENNLKNGSKFKSYYPFYFSTMGPLMETIRALEIEKLFVNRIEPLSIQVVLPSGRCELKNTDRRTDELQWLLGGDFESEMTKLKKLETLSERIKKMLRSSANRNYKIKDRVMLWFLKRKLSQESRLINIQKEHFFFHILKNCLAFPLLNKENYAVSPFYSSIVFGDAFILEGYPDSFIDLIKKNLSRNIEMLPVSDIQIDRDIACIRRGREAITFKFMVIDSALVKSLFPVSNDKIFKNLKPVSFWFPVQLKIKKEGFPVGMGKYVVLINPDLPPQNANLLYIKTDINATEVILNTYSVWRMEELGKKKWIENIVGSVMDRLIEFMPFVNKHLLYLVYPEKIEDLPANFFNYLYNLKTRAGLFSPVIKSKLRRRVFLAGAELFPQWGIDADAISARYVADKITRIMKE